jgi:class 3 adenylate cyclase
MTIPHARAVLFVDVTGSTRLYEELGDEQAHALIDHLLRVIERAAGEHGGRVIKEIGDGLMCAFADAAAALHAAHAMHLALSEDGRGASLGIHVGCHYGSVLEEAGDLYGDCVNVAARVAGLARSGQILVTRELVDRLDELLRRRVRSLGHVAVKGRRDRVELLEYVWETLDELTMVRQSASRERVARLRLVYGGRERWFDSSPGVSITLGRDAASDVVVGDREASRRHAHVEARRDRFVLVDHSVNGTYVAFAGEAEVCLRREELMLRARGRIALGRSTEDARATIVEFQCE